MYDVINKMYKARVKGAGILQCDTSKLVLLEERCTIKGLGTGECIKGNFNKLDRTNKCCNIYSTDYVEPVFIGRDPNYPW